MRIDLIPTADEIKKETLSGQTAIALDILRATSTIVTAMACGCREMVPVETVVEALSTVQKRPDVILGGERESLLIPGFHLGNSPLEYTREKVGGKVVVLTTTNGTRAIRRAAVGSGEVLIGSVLNAGAVAREALNTGRDIVFICAGTRGEFSLEDTVAAGLIMMELYNLSGGNTVLPGSDLAVAAWRLGEFYAHNPLQALYDSLHGQKLAGMGLAADMEWCARLNCYDLVPAYQRDTIIVKS
ncbi:putative 2-phosphosulfolactate phosphatase [Pelotomaculum schinkii]|uniref:Probable 2-phosphosulfolactate phosphatase n=1 Tax=Pelotomaculum schinkii TaxID=78350 RepID=A0A4Y7R7A4_9FIRM|nr:MULTISPECIES: 2-phosphosulfolactate phosphatase [Pelotomaculum]TEB04622.1 putative 2-phosphosulfolactate phosphatase [Pelotomaculum schinkii]